MTGDVRVIQQTARLTGQLANSAPVPSDALYSSSLLQGASPTRQGYADLMCQNARRSPQQHTIVAPSTIFVKPLGPHVGAQYLCACPFGYKRGGMRRYKTGSHTPNLRQTLISSYKLPKQYITQWSRVLRSGGLNHSKPLCVLVFVHPSRITGKTLRPLLILGFRAGAIHHPAGEIFPSDRTYDQRLQTYCQLGARHHLHT
jgi:hypothetical protein